MNDLSASDIKRHMIDIIAAGIEQQVSRLCLADGDRLSPGRLVPGASSCADAEMREDALGKSGTVSTACKACPTVHLRIAQELLCIGHHRIPGRRYHFGGRGPR